MTSAEKLRKKMESEYDEFIERIKKTGSVDTAIEKAYEIIYKQEIIACTYDPDMKTSEIDNLLMSEYPLEMIYDEWMDTDASVADMLQDCIRETADKIPGLLDIVKPDLVESQTMSELKITLFQYELKKAGYPNAVYVPETDSIRVNPNDERTPSIADNGDILYGKEHRDFVDTILKPLVSRINEVVSAWEAAKTVPFENLSNYRVLMEYNNVMLAARDDTGGNRGLHFVTWEYDYNRNGLNHGHYTEDYDSAKADFAVRAGLIETDMVVTPEKAALDNESRQTGGRKPSILADIEQSEKEVKAQTPKPKNKSKNPEIDD